MAEDTTGGKDLWRIIPCQCGVVRYLLSHDAVVYAAADAGRIWSGLGLFNMDAGVRYSCHVLPLVWGI